MEGNCMTADTALLRATPTSTPGYVPAITGRPIAVMLSNGDWMVWGLQDTDGAAILGGDEAMIIANIVLHIVAGGSPTSGHHARPQRDRWHASSAYGTPEGR